MVYNQYAHIYGTLLAIMSIYSSTTHENYMEHISTQQKTPIKMVIFDLDGVLLKTSRFGIAKQITRSKQDTSLFAFIRHALRKNPKDSLFELMDAAQDVHDYGHTAWEPKGTVLPQMMTNWLAGRSGYDSYTIMKYLHDTLDKQEYQDESYQVLRRLIPAIFDPEVRAQHTHIQKSGYKLLRDIQARYPSCQFAILSNYDTTCFQHIYTKPKLQRVFKRFNPERTFISADIQMTKPDTRIYEHVCITSGIDPSECLCIDDQEANVIAARKAGMHAIQFTPEKARYIQRQVRRMLQT